MRGAKYQSIYSIQPLPSCFYILSGNKHNPVQAGCLLGGAEAIVGSPKAETQWERPNLIKAQ